MNKHDIKPDFSWIKWKVGDLEKNSINLLDEKKKILAEIKEIKKDKRTFKNTILALEESSYKLSDTLNKIEFLMYVSPDQNIRNKAQSISEKKHQEWLEIEQDKDLLRLVDEYMSQKPKLQGAHKKLLEDLSLAYNRRGFNLPISQRKKLLKNLQELTRLSIAFNKNINEYDDYILISKSETRGLPDTYLKNLSKKNGKYKVSLTYPDYFPFMEYAEDEKLRKILSEKFLRRAASNNPAIMKKILKLRYENAKILGYKNPAHFELEVKMAKDPKKVESFLKDLSNKIVPLAKKDIKQILDEKKLRTGNKKAKLYFHDLAYYSRLLRERVIGIDEDEIRKHFQYQKVKEGVFTVYSKLLGVKFKKINMMGWHDDVESYEIYQEGRVIAYFFLDMFPRKGKFGHAAAFNIISGRLEGNSYKKPVSCLMMNLPPETRDQASLLSHGEVTTFFHEFGHIMHQCLTKAPYASQSGSSVAQDFVEAPSQIFENWAWQKDILREITSHYKTNKKIPDILIDKIIDSKNFLEPSATARQLVFANFDLLIHTRIPSSINSIFKSLQDKFIGVPFPSNSFYPASFGHFVGYEAGYYGYLWSNVYAADMFTKFEKSGILNSKIGLKYRKEVLEVGSSRKEELSVEKFLGRKSNNKAFLREMGLK